MLPQILTIVLTALLTSALTVGGAWWLYRRHLRRELDEQLAAAIEDLEARLQVISKDLGDTIETRVRQGVVKGVTDLPSSDVFVDTTRTVARTGAEIAGTALGALLGRRRPDKD